MRFRPLLLCLALLATRLPLLAQANFECQAPPCLYTFPVGKNAPGDCERVSWNGLGLATVDRNNSCGFPCVGNQYLRVVANGPVNAGPCQPPSAPGLPWTAVYIPIPLGATQVSFCWDFYNCEGPGSPRNDGMVIDVIGNNCQFLGLLAAADTFKLIGPCIDGPPAGCPSNCPGVDLGLLPGPEIVTNAPLPAGGAFIRVAVWNGLDNLNPSHGVVDGVRFGPTCPGTEFTFGDDITGIGVINGINQAGDTHTVPVGSFFGFRTLSPGTTFNFAPLFVLGEGYACTAGPPAPAIPGQICVSGSTSTLLLAGGPGPFGLPLVLPPAPGHIVTYGPNPGLLGACLKVQGLVTSPLAANAIFATTNCHTFIFN